MPDIESYPKIRFVNVNLMIFIENNYYYLYFIKSFLEYCNIKLDHIISY